jgi:exopolyphosphatase / guanosine-5'-triphosphate,3'-diphosphate pyrophosphatase
VTESERMESAHRLMRRYESEVEHARHVCRLALNFFDQLQSLHHLNELERQWLEAAALLHDIGWSQPGQAHHKASLQLILQEGMPGWSEEELLVVANIARYHRKSPPKAKHRYFARLPAVHQVTVARLAAILRLADGLDRLHDASVQQLICRQEDQQICITISAVGDAATALAGLERKKELFEELYLRTIVTDIQPV